MIDVSLTRCPSGHFFPSVDHFGWVSVIITRQNIYGSGRPRCCCGHLCGCALAVMSNLASMWAGSSVSSKAEGSEIILTYQWFPIRAIHCHESVPNQCPVNVNVESAPWLLNPTPPVLALTKSTLRPSMSKRKKKKNSSEILHCPFNKCR